MEKIVDHKGENMSLFSKKKILVTGGTGSLGKELVRHLLMDTDSEIVRIYDVDETDQFELQQELKDHGHACRYFLGDVRDKERLNRAAEEVDIIFHTAALKHVMACEYNPFEAIKTNVLGMQNVIDVSINNNVKKIIFTSSDKAVNPSNTMGATKLLAERLVTSANCYKGPRDCVFSSVRFGNVMGSRGSVIPLFMRQIKYGGPITITDPTMTRFMMSMSQAVELVFRSAEMAVGGEVFIFKMPTVNILDLAEVLIEELAPKYNHNPDDIAIDIIGPKPGEKMYEELMTEDEANRSLERDDMYIILPVIREGLPDFDESMYDASSVHSNDYISKFAIPISKKEIKAILLKDNII